MGTMVEVSVRVPEERVGDFYLMHGKWLQELESRDSARPKTADWEEKDSELAKLVLRAMPRNSKAFLDMLIVHGEMDSETVAGRLGLDDPSQVTGVSGWVGRVSNKFGRKTPVKARAEKGRTIWLVDPAVAAIFRRIWE